MSWNLRIAEQGDVPQLADLIPRSSFELQKNTYSPAQISAALGPVFGVDEQLIEDGTYYVVEEGDTIIGCGGWSFRKSLFGGNASRSEPDPKLDPKMDAARIRAFFTDPAHARKGIASAILKRCEEAVIAMGFRRVEISSTLVGKPLYTKFGYRPVEHYVIPLEGTESMEVWKMIKTL